jgi:hypothetical protein
VTRNAANSRNHVVRNSPGFTRPTLGRTAQAPAIFIFSISTEPIVLLPIV